MMYSIQKKDRLRKVKAGFTIIEIMIAITILGLIMYFLLPRFTGVLDKARVRSTRLMMQTLKNALTMYKVDVGEYPERLRDPIKRPSEEKHAKKWDGPYLDDKELPGDSWGNQYKYEKTQAGFDLYSYGPKGKDAPKEERIKTE